MIHFLGQDARPFSRTFFNAILGDILEGLGKERVHRMTLYLSDGSTMDVCSIEELAEEYLILRTFKEESDVCNLGVEVVPYGLIYRITLSPRHDSGTRVGFSWKPGETKGVAKKKR